MLHQIGYKLLVGSKNVTKLIGFHFFIVLFMTLPVYCTDSQKDVPLKFKVEVFERFFSQSTRRVLNIYIYVYTHIYKLYLSY